MAAEAAPSGQWTTERISRALVSFGRYSHNRPSGLHLDASGNFSLRNLMEVWGQHEGLTEEDVLGAVRSHMFHENEPGSLRFAVGGDEEGNILLRVLPKRGYQRACATPSRTQWQRQGSSQWRTWAPTAPKWGGGGAQAKLTPAPKAATANPPATAPAAPWQDQGKQGAAPDKPARDKAAKEEDGEKAGAWGGSWKEGAGGSNWSKDAWDWSATEARGRRGGGRGGGRGASRRHGWDWAGEEAAEGQGGDWPRRGPKAGKGKDEGAARQARGADQRPHRERRRAISSSSSSSSRRSRSRTRVRSCRQPSTSPPPEVRRAAQEEAAAAQQRGQPPSGPPGAFWTQYQDNGVYWWHYQGPCGQWFCANGEEPQPYVPDPA